MLRCLVVFLSLILAELVDGAFDLGFQDDSDLTSFVTVGVY